MEPSVIFLVMLFVVTTISAAGTSSRTSQDRTCTPFEGNSDLYGFGIRLGVYLQWISSWITNTLNPKSAAPNHDTNSIWVLAVVCAGAAAIAGDDIRPIEVYIMLLICYGYFMTVLNMFGFRIRLLSPVHLPKLMKTLEEAFRACSRFSHQTLASWSDRFDIFLKELSLEQPVLAYLKFFWNPAIDTVTVPLKAASSMKHDSFSWGGVAWRVAIASAVYSSSIWYWFGNWRSARASANEEDCNTQVFLFGLRSLESHTVTFFRTVTIAMAIPMLWLAVLSIGILTKIWVLSFFYMLISAQANHAEYFSASRWYRFLSLKSGSVGNMLGVDYQHNDREHATLSLVQAWLSLSSALPSQPEDKLSMKFVKERYCEAKAYIRVLATLANLRQAQVFPACSSSSTFFKLPPSPASYHS